jgi:TolB protein
VLVNGSTTHTSNHEPNWSPDGTKIVFQRVEPGGFVNLYTVSPAGGTPSRVTNDRNSDTDASWSRDSKWIVYSSDYKGGTGALNEANIFVVGATGGTPVRVTNQPYYDGAPSWSPDGKTISFESAFISTPRDEPTGIWSIAAPALP